MTFDEIHDFAIGIIGLRKQEFLRMTWGEYITISLGHQKRVQDELHKYRNTLGAILRKNPKELFYLPGDVNFEMLEKIKYITPDKVDAWLKQQDENVRRLHKVDG